MIIDPHKSPIKDKQEISAKKQQESKINIIGHMSNIPGLFIWECDPKEGTIIKAEIEISSTIKYDKDPNNLIPKKKILRKKGKFYVQALNYKNAYRKAKKWIKDNS